MAKKTCWLCGYTDWTGTNFTTWNNHKVHVGCLTNHLLAKKRTLEILAKIKEVVGIPTINNG